MSRERLPFSKRRVKAVVAALIALGTFLFYRFYEPEKGRVPENTGDSGVSVSRVIDGDTIELSGGERVRYAGIDTPERDRPFYSKAKERNSELLKAGKVEVVVCAEQPKDKYGRTLAWVYSGGVDVSAALLKEGLARTLSIPPCGLVKYKEYKALEKGARAANKGVWGSSKKVF